MIVLNSALHRSSADPTAAIVEAAMKVAANSSVSGCCMHRLTHSDRASQMACMVALSHILSLQLNLTAPLVLLLYCPPFSSSSIATGCGRLIAADCDLASASFFCSLSQAQVFIQQTKLWLNENAPPQSQR